MANEIFGWLEKIKTTKNKIQYEKGIRLYGKYGGSSNYIRILERTGVTDKTWEGLEYELSKMIDRADNVNNEQEKNSEAIKEVPAITVIPVIEQKNNIPESIKKQDEDIIIDEINTPKYIKPLLFPNEKQILDGEYPMELKILISEKNELFKLSVAAFHTLKYMQVAQRGKAALKILDNFDRINEIWEQVDYYNEHKRLIPEKKKPEAREDKISQMNLISLINLRNNLRCYVSRSKRLKDTAVKQSTRNEHERKMLEYELELAAVDDRIKKIS